MKPLPLNQIPLKEWSETELEDHVYRLSCELDKYQQGSILLRILLRMERTRILKELIRRDENKC